MNMVTTTAITAMRIDALVLSLTGPCKIDSSQLQTVVTKRTWKIQKTLLKPLELFSTLGAIKGWRTKSTAITLISTGMKSKPTCAQVTLKTFQVSMVHTSATICMICAPSTTILFLIASSSGLIKSMVTTESVKKQCAWLKRWLKSTTENGRPMQVMSRYRRPVKNYSKLRVTQNMALSLSHFYRRPSSMLMQMAMENLMMLSFLNSMPSWCKIRQRRANLLMNDPSLQKTNLLVSMQSTQTATALPLKSTTLALVSWWAGTSSSKTKPEPFLSNQVQK